MTSISVAFERNRRNAWTLSRGRNHANDLSLCHVATDIRRHCLSLASTEGHLPAAALSLLPVGCLPAHSDALTCLRCRSLLSAKAEGRQELDTLLATHPNLLIHSSVLHQSLTLFTSCRSIWIVSFMCSRECFASFGAFSILSSTFHVKIREFANACFVSSLVSLNTLGNSCNTQVHCPNLLTTI